MSRLKCLGATSRAKQMNSDRKAFLVGGGIGSLAAAAFMIRDGGMTGDNITVFEALPLFGGSLDAAGNPDEGYIIRGSRMMTTENFECTWALFQSIPSLSDPSKSVFEETMSFSEVVRWNAKARLIDRNLEILDVTSMGFSMKDRFELMQLSEADECELENMRITDWLSPGFFETKFWYLWQTTFAFQPWHSAIEFKRYLHRFIRSFPRIGKLSGVKHPVLNHHDSFIRPLVSWLRAKGVRMEAGVAVTDLGITSAVNGKISVSSMRLNRSGNPDVITVRDEDLVLVQNGSMTDASSLGSMTSAPKIVTKEQSGGWQIWEKLAKGRPEFGNPFVFNTKIPETRWTSFTVTLRDAAFFNRMEAFSGNAPGTGGIVTFKDSNWLISVVLYHQPHFVEQPDDVQVFWGYALHPDRIGNFVAKPLLECSGGEIIRELCGHLNFDPRIFERAICIPCAMPYITSQFMPRRVADRPLPVPRNSHNLAFVSQFVEIAEDVVFTVEYSVRAAQMAVYEMLNLSLQVPPVTPHDRSLGAKLNAVIKAFK
ncbi:MAG: oleate hydratase [Candidatus Promineifilaceae bacterium]